MRNGTFLLVSLAVAAAVFLAARWTNNGYVFFAGYVVLQYVVLATGWNILGGYTGYVNFGVAGFFALGAYSTVAVEKLVPLPLPVVMLAVGVGSALLGVGMGLITLRLRGAFFSIATLAMAIVAQTFVVNWSFVGGSAGAFVIRPMTTEYFGVDYIRYLFLLMLGLCVIVVFVARLIERSHLGDGFAAIRDDELAAEASGVPTLRLKLFATALSGAFLGMAGAPLPFYVTYLDPPSAFSLAYAVNTIAMPLIGGTAGWAGPIVGAVLIATLEQVATVTISSAVNLLIVGLVLVGFVIAAPQGIMGWFGLDRRARARPRKLVPRRS
ncbi:MAG: branched-chain amino acid ABC transporter permease [Acetobacteraceae bacterium]